MEQKMIILGSRNYANRRILHELQERGVKARILDPTNILPFINDKRNDRVYIQTENADEPKRLYKKSLSVIIPRIGTDLHFFSKSVEHIANNIGVPTTATATALLNAQDKIRTVQLLSQNGIKTPKTFAVKKATNLQWIVDKLDGFPVVAKLIFGSRGIGIFILTEPLSASTALDAFSSQGHSLLLQQFIETAEKDKNKHDFRAVVIDGKVVAAIRRNSIDTDFRTNASLKDNSEAAELDSEMTAIAIKAAAAVGLACAGVDIAKDINTGEVYVYEVNGNFDFKSTEKHSKKNVAAAIAEYALKLAKGDKAADTVKQAEPSFDVAQLSVDKGIPFLKFPADLEDEDTEMEFSSMVTPLKGFNDWSKMGEMLADDSRLTKQIFDKMAKKGKPLNSWELKALKLSK